MRSTSPSPISPTSRCLCRRAARRARRTRCSSVLPATRRFSGRWRTTWRVARRSRRSSRRSRSACASTNCPAPAATKPVPSPASTSPARTCQANRRAMRWRCRPRRISSPTCRAGRRWSMRLRRASRRISRAASARGRTASFSGARRHRALRRLGRDLLCRRRSGLRRLDVPQRPQMQHPARLALEPGHGHLRQRRTGQGRRPARVRRRADEDLRQ